MLLFFFFAAVQYSQAQNKTPLEYQVKAAFLFNFTRFINWPPSAFKSSDAPFIIGITGIDPFGSYLDELVEGETVAGHPIVVQRYRAVKDVADCQILFIAVSDSETIKGILSVASRRNILTVSDADNFTNLGGAIRFFKEENKIKIEINKSAVKLSQLDVSAKLLRLARVN
jgi:hypothetical protein